jgi:Arc/MetJ family transcription regulator
MTISTTLKPTTFAPQTHVAVNDALMNEVLAITHLESKEEAVELILKEALKNYRAKQQRKSMKVRKEIEIALKNTRADLAAGRFTIETADEHLRRLRIDE